MAAICWSVALVLGAIGIYLHQILILWVGCGMIGGIGIGIGYISPVSDTGQRRCSVAKNMMIVLRPFASVPFYCLELAGY